MGPPSWRISSELAEGSLAATRHMARSRNVEADVFAWALHNDSISRIGMRGCIFAMNIVVSFSRVDLGSG